MLKKYDKTLVIGAVILLFAMLIIKYISVPIPSSYLGTRLYQGQRIAVQLNITVDGESANISKNDEEAYSLINSDDVFKLSAKADSYDTYEYSLLINDEIPLHITARHWNWWEIIRSKLYIDINTQTNSYTVFEEYYYTAELPNYHIQNVTEPKESFDLNREIYVSIGPKG